MSNVETKISVNTILGVAWSSDNPHPVVEPIEKTVKLEPFFMGPEETSKSIERLQPIAKSKEVKI